MKMTATQLRANLFQSLDYVIDTGNPIEIERKGQLIIITTKKQKNRLANLVSRNIVKGNDEDLVSMDWSKEWNDDLP